MPKLWLYELMFYYYTFFNFLIFTFLRYYTLHFSPSRFPSLLLYILIYIKKKHNNNIEYI